MLGRRAAKAGTAIPRFEDVPRVFLARLRLGVLGVAFFRAPRKAGPEAGATSLLARRDSPSDSKKGSIFIGSSARDGY